MTRKLIDMVLPAPTESDDYWNNLAAENERLEVEVEQLKAENESKSDMIHHQRQREASMDLEIETLRHYFSEHEKLIAQLKEELKREREKHEELFNSLPSVD